MPDRDGSERVADTYEVEGSYHVHTTEGGDRVRLSPGDTFHPTRKQVETGSLANKARKVREGSPPTSTTVDADIGLRALEWGSPAALKLALDHEVDADAFADAVEPSGATGYLKSDVRGYLEARA